MLLHINGKNGNNISGATSSAYSISSTATNDSGTYTVDAYSCGTITSNDAIITINASPTAITISPTSASVCSNAITTLTASGGITEVPILVQTLMELLMIGQKLIIVLTEHLQMQHGH